MGRQRKNIILGLENGDRRWISSEEGMLKIASDYFQRLFTVSDAGDDK